MPTPNEKLASSLEILKDLQRDHGNILKSNQLSRTHRERLRKNGFLNDIIPGWPVVTLRWSRKIGQVAKVYSTA